VGTDRIEHSKVEIPAGVGAASVDQGDEFASEPRVTSLESSKSSRQSSNSVDSVPPSKGKGVKPRWNPWRGTRHEYALSMSPSTLMRIQATTSLYCHPGRRSMFSACFKSALSASESRRSVALRRSMRRSMSSSQSSSETR
jgi:hypothetical protein